MDCLFCKILNGEMPSKKLYEDEKVIAILDAFPNVDGHTLIIPKKHYTDFLEMPGDLIEHIHEVSKKLAPILMERLNAESLTFVVNYGKMQAIKHYHFHLLPNYGIQKKATLSAEEVFERLQDLNI